MKALPIGISDFKELIELDYFYADKTDFINELLTNQSYVTLFIRPRRFGKTLNMSMFRYFFDIRTAESNKKLFRGLNIEKTEFWKEQGKYPVIFISFKDIKGDSWEDCLKAITTVINDLYKSYEDVFDKLNDMSKNKWEATTSDDVSSVRLQFSLKTLSDLLYRIYNKNVIILIDEYDTPIISAHENNYYDKAIRFFDTLYSSALKDNSCLHFGIMTGITRTVKAGTFSGLNNIVVNTILDNKYQDHFGLSESDVDNALKEYKLKDSIDKVKEWYNGYLFGNKEVYNPWSIINYLNERKLAPYWINASDNYLINKVLSISDERTYENLKDLFNGIEIRKYIDEEMDFYDFCGQGNIWNFLLFSGYLAISKDMEESRYLLKIPNKEIYSFFENNLLKELKIKYKEL